MNDITWAAVVILCLIAIALFGGTKNAHNTILNNSNQNTVTSPQVISPSQNQVNPNQSVYTNQVTLLSGEESQNANQEYVQIQANSTNNSPVDITGWKLTDNETNFSVTIPQSTALYFADSPNSEQDVVLAPGETVYIVTGRSPIGYGLHANMCSGYLSQFNSFTPNLYSACPSAMIEASGTIPHTINNNNCFDLIEDTPICSTHTTALDNTYSPECQQLFSTTLTYQSCVNEHKNDANFYSPAKWYVYLQRDEPLWNAERDSVTLTDTSGKAIATANIYY